MSHCPSCGATYAVDQGFCPNDGTALSVAAPAVVAQQAAMGQGWHAGLPQPPRSVAYTGHEGGPHEHAAAHQVGLVAEALAAGPQPRNDPSFEDSLLLGKTLGQRYRIEQRIGCGGMGVVYRASHIAIEKTLAVKVLRMQYLDVEDVAQRFALEARVASKIKHVNVVDITDYGSTDQGAPYFVMEYLPGHSLAYEIDHFGRIDPRRALTIAAQIAAGLAAAHEHGIIHRDLKPDNIMLCPGAPAETAKILDFGIARLLGRKSRLTAEGAVIGTPEYMSPEQAQGEEVDMRSDLYSLGVILFEMLTGSVPFRSDSMVGILTKQVFDAPPLLRTIDPQLGSLPQVERVLARLLSKNRDERPQSAYDAQGLIMTALVSDLGDGNHQANPQAATGARPTIAIGSWSVGESAQAAGVFEAQPQRRGPQMRPPSHHGSLQAPPGFAAAQQQGPSAPAAMGPRGGPGVVVRADTPSHHIPAPSAPPPSPIPAQARPGSAASVSRAKPRRSNRLVPMVLLGAGAAIFAGLVTVGVVNWLNAKRGRETSAGATELEQAAERAPAAMQDRNLPIPAPAAAGAEPAVVVGTAASDASVEEAEADADADAISTANAGTGKKRGKKRSEPPVQAPKSKSEGTADEIPGAGANAKKGGSVKDPPAEPGVTLGDLKDPFL